MDSEYYEVIGFGLDVITLIVESCSNNGVELTCALKCTGLNM